MHLCTLADTIVLTTLSTQIQTMISERCGILSNQKPRINSRRNQYDSLEESGVVTVIRTSLGIAYNVLISDMSDRMDIADRNTLWSRKYVRIACIHYV